jgi:hypothetical protein
MKLKKLNRIYAFYLHILFSLLIATFSAALVFFVWYPSLLAQVSNVNNIYILLLIVDVTLGPLITLIIFNVEEKAEKELRSDILIIGIFQIIALIYGLHTLYITRPVFVVYNEGRFDVIHANDISESNLKKSKNNDFRKLPILGPRYIGAELPVNINERNVILFDSLSGGDDISRLPQYYTPYEQAINKIKKRSQPLENLNKLNQDNQSMIESLKSKYINLKINVGYLPLKGKASDLTVIVDTKSGKILELVNINPWN